MHMVTTDVAGYLHTAFVPVVPAELAVQVAMEFHASASEGGHMGVGKTIAKLRMRFWWSTMYRDVQNVVGGCVKCQMVGQKLPRKTMSGGGITASEPFEFIAMDLLALPESLTGNKYAMVVMDYFSRYAIVVAIPDKTAETVASVLVDQVVLKYGPPNKLLTDNGGEFKNALMSAIMQALKAERVFTAPYNPQCDGMVERFNRTLLHMLACYVKEDQKDWDMLLPHLVYAYNNTPPAAFLAAGITPFQIVFGRTPRSVAYGEFVEGNSEYRALFARAGEAVRRWLQQLSDDKKAVGNADSNAGRRKLVTFAPGTMVWMVSHGRGDTGTKTKLDRKFRGPYVVLNMVGDTAVRIRPVGSSDAHTTVHADQLTAYKVGQAEAVKLIEPGRPSDAVINDGGKQPDEDEGGDWGVSAVMDHRFVKGRLQFYVSWEDENSADSWIEEKDMDCHSLVQEYFQRKCTHA